MQVNRTLTSLNLFGNNLGESGVAPIVDALKVCQCAAAVMCIGLENGRLAG